ncbi:MAG: efflux RND transporter periplasmic adaptor subunit [Candidatus Omnitrophota bacterium]
MPLKKKKLFFMVFIVIAGVLILYAYNTFIRKPKPLKEEGVKKEEVQKEEQIIPVRVFKVAKQDFVDYFPSMGTAKGAAEVNLKFEATGAIEALNYKEGDVIKRGDVIATLNQRDAQLNIEYNKSKLKTAQAETQAVKKRLEVYQKLYEAGSIIKAKLDEITQEFEVAKSKVETAKLEVEHAENELEKQSLFAPIDGVLTAKDVEIGELANANTKVGTLSDLSVMYIEIGLTESDIEKIKVGQTAKLNFDTYPNQEFNGVIDNIFPQIEGKSRTLTVKIKVDNKDLLIKPGMFSRVAIKIFEKKDALLIPVGALRGKEGKYFLFLAKQEGAAPQQEDKKEEPGKYVALQREVKPEYRTIESAVIKEGLSEGDLVVTESQGELKDKSPCEVLEIQESGSKESQKTESENEQPMLENPESAQPPSNLLDMQKIMEEKLKDKNAESEQPDVSQE